MGAPAEPKLTDQQRRAVTTEGVSIALSAGAGCGKTFVLTERFLAALAPERHRGQVPSLSEIIAITFTERAAREMRNRIRRACRDRLARAPEKEADYWLGLVRELDSARISTIHSFCGSLLRSHAVEARLDPHFAILQQAQADTLLAELIDDELRSRLAARDEATIELVADFNLDGVREMIAGLLGKRYEIDWAAWAAVTPEELAARWEAFHREEVLPGALGRLADSTPARAVLEIARRHRPANAVMQARCDELVARLERLAGSDDPAADLAAIQASARVQGGGGKSAWPDEAVYERLKDAAKDLRELAKKLEPTIAFDAAAARPAAEAGLRLLEIAGSVNAAYDARKAEVPALDFNDLLIRAKELLTAPEHKDLRRRLSSQTRLLLVDEFQDTDPLQVELVRAMAGEGVASGKLFIVGDFKQSIYRFRGADPHVFQEVRGATPAKGRLPLTLNFRSQPAVLDFVNALFCEELGPEYEPLQPSRVQVAPEPAVEFLWAPDDTPDVRTGQTQRLRQREADWIARRLRAMLDAGEPVVRDEAAAEAGKPAARAVKPGDVALLFRALSDVEHYEAALRRCGIDYYLVGGHAFYAQQEIFDVLNLLRALAFADDELSLAGVLRSPMFGLEDETLFWLARHPEGLSAGLFAETPPEEVSQEQRRRVAFAATALADLHAARDRVPVAELIQQAMDRTGYDAVLLAEFLGERKLANLKKLVQQARSMDGSSIFTLADFITQLSEFVARQPDEPLAATSPESTDVVKLMSIHQSKGLEFPVVVVPDLDRQMQGGRSSVAFTPELGPMVKTAGPDGHQLHAAVQQAEDRAELVRLLYVAATRAADYLVLSSGVREPGTGRGPWMDLLGRRFDLLTGEPRGDLPEGYRVPKIRVTTEEPPIGGKPAPRSPRRTLAGIVDKAAAMAAKGGGRVPEHLGPVPPDPDARRGYSFSRLRGTLHRMDLPAEEEEGPAPLDPRGLGTLVHEVLAEIEFGGRPDAAALVRRRASRHLPEAGDRLDEPIELVRRFLDSPRAAELAAAAAVHRELEFMLVWPPGTPEPGSRYLHGFIDCLYQDASGAWHVVDYKTNRASGKTLAAVAAEYEMQMLVYGLAVERILGSRPAELVLCFLRPGLEHEVTYDSAAADRVVEMVNRSIAEIVGERAGSRQ